MKKTALAVIFAICCALASQSVMPQLQNVDNEGRAAAWADSVYATMSLDQRVGQLLFPKLIPTMGAESKAAIRTMVNKYHIGGILFTHGTLEEYVEMTNYAQEISKIPLMMTFDGEWSLSMRIPDTPNFPRSMGLGAIQDQQLIYEYGRETARECRELGIHVNFAPVADVNSNPQNPVIGHRAFGENADRVARAVVAYSKGLEDGGVISTAKHFPGHGDTDLDSHFALPTVSHSKAQLDSVDLKPFKSYIAAGLSGVMVGHLCVPQLDSSGTPASLSQEITTGLLKNKLGFKGLVFTDALGMAGAKVGAGKNNCVEALRAGADVLLSSSSPADDFHAILNALKTGYLSEDIIADRCKKILKYKYKLGLNEKPEPIIIKGLKERVNSPEAHALNCRLAAESMTLLRNTGNILPLSNLDKNNIAVVTIGEKAHFGDFSEVCGRYANIATFHTNTGGFTAETLAKISKHNVVIAAVSSGNQAARTAMAQLSNVSNLIEVFFVNPYKMNKFGESLNKASAILLAYDDTPYTQSFAAQAIFGGIDVNGKLPVNLKGIATEGTGLEIKKNRIGFGTPTLAGFNEALTDSVDAICNAAVAAGAFPGCRVLVVKDGIVAVDKAYGTIGSESTVPVTEGTLYDLASVSKTIGTLPGIMKAYDLGLVKLDKTVYSYLPGFDDKAKSDITVEQLLYHESGMPPSLNMFVTMMDTATYKAPIIKNKPDDTHTIKIQNGAWGATSAKLRTDITSPVSTTLMPIEAAKGIFVGKNTYDSIMNRIYHIGLRKDKSFCYSCLNFCLLMDIEQHVTGTDHYKWMTDSVWAPLGATSICYRPTLRHPLNEIAVTEKDSYLRKQTVHGYVHDELAAFSGGVQGNAGVFSNAYDIAKICQMWLNGGTYGGKRILSPQTVKLFTTSKTPRSRRGLGFDKPDTKDPDRSPTFEGAPGCVYGHTGFTGTVFWVDPEKNIIFIFLSNRVNPTRDNAAFAQMNIRPGLFEQVYKNLK